jgi:acyl carrier protein
LNPKAGQAANLPGQSSVLARTRLYVRDTFLYMRPGFVLGDDDRLLERGIIDSMGVLELIAFLETEFGVTVGDDDVTEENLGTLASIDRYVASRRGNGNTA